MSRAVSRSVGKTMKRFRIHFLSSVVIGGFGASCHPIGPPGDEGTRLDHQNHGAPLLGGSSNPPVSSGTTVPQAATADSSRPAAAGNPTSISPSLPAAPGPSSGAPAASKPAASTIKPTPPAVAKDDIPTAQKAPGRPGYVLSPFTGKLMLVRGIPSGVVVPDQTSADSGKKFRVP